VSEVLSNEQVADLVAAAKEGTIPSSAPQRRGRPRRVRDIDFSRPSKFTQEQVRRYLRAHDAFCRTVSTRLSAELRTPVELEAINADQLTWSSALGEIPQPSLLAFVETEPHGTLLLLSAELPTVMRLVDLLLGGTGQVQTSGRELSEIELSLAARVFHTIVDQLSITWQELFDTSLTLRHLETQIANANFVPSTEPTLILTLEARSGQAASSTVTLAVPYRSIETVVGKLSANVYDLGGPAPDEDSANAVRASLTNVAVELRAEIASTGMSVGDVLGLSVGDVIRFDSPASAGITLCADTVPIHRARPGRSGNHRAVEVVERLEESE
jgi:flagellar motor switch protein FliM